MADPPVVADRTFVYQSQMDEPLQTPADGRRRAEVEQQQTLDGQRAPLFFVIADFDNKHTVNRGLKAGKILLRDCL